MHKPDQSELETIVADAEGKAAKAAPAPAESSALREIRDHATALATDMFTRSGIDHGTFDQLRQKHDDELRRADEEAQRAAAGAAAATSARLDTLVKGQLDVLTALPEDPFGPGSELLNTVVFVRSWPTPENLRDSRLEPGVNWAKYQVSASSGEILQEGSERVSFYLLWHNPQDVTALADVLVRLTINGHCNCHAEGGGFPAAFFFPDSRSELYISARLTLWPLWLPNAPQMPISTVPITSLTSTGGVFSHSANTGVSAAPAVSTTRFAVPANAYIMIEASIAAEYKLLRGGAGLDCASENLFNVGCAYGVVRASTP